ncbi:MAG: hypothetical protein K2Y56_06850 [Methylobacterium sp.]|nr:hypothetical protein [Methylobacterium sp.]MBX9931241.1 hypothetical protein [Methylobacterium sp.]
MKAVYVARRKPTCACVDLSSMGPLGFVSFAEYVMMAIMGMWTLVGSH